MTDKKQQAMDLIAQMLPPETAKLMAENKPEGFGSELSALAFDNVFVNLWTRPGLSPRDRSLVTVSILIALRAHEELHFHLPAALRNGVTREELEEVIYQASGYAGFPAAASAQQLAKKILDDE